MEFDLIELIRPHTAQPRDDVRLGIGDDAAVLAVPTGQELVVAVFLSSLRLVVLLAAPALGNGEAPAGGAPTEALGAAPLTGGNAGSFAGALGAAPLTGGNAEIVRDRATLLLVR